MNEKKNELQMSEAFLTSIFLAVSGGFQDAYTYNTREEVFSNAQTGNVVLMSQNFMVGRWMDGLRYLFPLLAFAFGVFFAERIQGRFKYAKRLHWRQGILLLEIVILFAVGFIPQEYNMAATVLVSFACAMQVQTFRKVNGYSYASTMCIGNLRSGTAAFSMYLRDKRPEQLRQSLYYFGIILFFAIGAGIGIGKIGGSAMEAIARQPEASNDIRTNMIIIAALVEGVALFAVVVCFLAL